MIPPLWEADVRIRVPASRLNYAVTDNCIGIPMVRAAANKTDPAGSFGMGSGLKFIY